MRFGVLGPLAVWTDAGETVRVPGKIRALLADLIIHCGRPVSAGRLVEDLWPASPPGNPAGTLQAKVSQLRRIIEDAEPGARGLIVSQSPGYLLRAEPDPTDSAQFAALAAAARTRKDLPGRKALFAEALALWRGPAFADLAGEPFVHAAAARLEEERLEALEDHAETRLALGEHAPLTGELGELVRANPLRERLRGILMRALYRCGRQSEALASFRDLRTRLLEEIGVDPGPEIAALHQAILNQRPELRPAPPATTGRSRTNLPEQLTGLVGRDEALTEIRTLFGQTRLLTLTGAGGVGKTRLAMEVAKQVAGTFADGAWLVELATLGHATSTAGSIAEVLLATLGIRDDVQTPLPGRDPVPVVQRLANTLRPQRLLLVLDNCEPVVKPAAELAESLLRSVPGLRILATSQEPLWVAGERLWTVPPLRLPDPGTGTEPAALGRSSAVELFVQRAAAAAPGFVLDDGNAADVAVLCRRLDGIPLALELAATRVRALGVAGLVARLDDRFRLLAAGYRGAPPRQQTLRAMIDWSWELLTRAERAVLRRLAAHAEGCALETAEFVCVGDAVHDGEVLSLLARLVDRSLVVMSDGLAGPRYRLLESVRHYCLGKLDEAGEAAALRVRYRGHYLGLAEQARLHDRDQREWLERLDIESANLREVFDGAVQDRDADSALRIANALAWYWFLRGRITEARRSFDAALEISGADPALSARALTWQLGIAIVEGDDVTVGRAHDVLAEIPDLGARTRAHWFLAFALFNAGHLDECGEMLDGLLTRVREVGDTWGEAATQSLSAALALARGDLTAIGEHGAASAGLFERLGDRWGQSQIVYPLAALAEITADYDRAARLHRDGLDMAESLGLWTEASERLSGLGRIALLTRDHAQAQDFHERALRLAVEQGYEFGEIYARMGLGLGARRGGDYDVAETHLRRVLDWNRMVAFEPGNTLVLAELGFVAEQRGDAAAALALHHESLALARKVGDPRAVALSLEGVAGARALAGQHDQAALLLGCAAWAREAAGAPLPSAERGDVDRITERACQALGAERFDREFRRGRELPAEDVADIESDG
ncbi:MAG: BTAD domain-containing putative transcriptional regulator [Kibdelosporangium sp.]